MMHGGAPAPFTAIGDTWTLRFESDWPDETCDNATDDDGDELVDCSDPDCDRQVCGNQLTCIDSQCQ